MLELFNGPTLAFKDIAMQVIGNMYENILNFPNRNNWPIAYTIDYSGIIIITNDNNYQRYLHTSSTINTTNVRHFIYYNTAII